MTDTRRVVVIGIDGATFKIIRPLSEEGRLPNITKLMKEGACGILMSTTPPVSPVAWTSFMTGVSPDKHGIFDFTGKVPGTYRFRINTSADRTAKPLWSYLSEIGKRVLVVGVTMTYPPDDVNGYMVSGLGAPPDVDVSAYCRPPEFGREMSENIGAYRAVPEGKLRTLHRSDSEKEKYLKGVFDQIEYRVRLFRHMWAKEKFDFSMLFFLDTDGVSHYFWKYMDRAHLHHEESRFSEAVRSVYEKVDWAVGEIMKTVENSASLVLVSDHGFGPLNRVIFMNNWLASKGYLSFGKRRALDSAKSVVRSLLGGRKTHAAREVDWRNTRAYFSGSVGNIFINLKGREPEGIVEPSDYDRICSELAGELLSLRDEITGDAPVASVHFRMADEKKPAAAPDLVALFNRGYGVVGDEISLHDIQDTGAVISDSMNWSGNHEPDGIFIAWGKQFRRGEEVSGANIIDASPSILYSMGVPIPAEMEGIPLSGAFADEFREANPLKYAEAGEVLSAPQAGLGDKDQEALMEQLRNLGYIE